MNLFGKTETDDLTVKGDFDLTNAVQRDLTFPVTAIKQGSNSKPDYDYTNNGFSFPQNDLTEVASMGEELDHVYKAGTPIQIHAHMRQSHSGQAVFAGEYRWTNGGETFGAWTPFTLDKYVYDYNSGGDMHQILYQELMIEGAGKGESSFFEMRVWRTDAVHTGEVVVKEFSVHYYADKIGKNLM